MKRVLTQGQIKLGAIIMAAEPGVYKSRKNKTSILGDNKEQVMNPQPIYLQPRSPFWHMAAASAIGALIGGYLIPKVILKEEHDLIRAEHHHT